MRKAIHFIETFEYASLIFFRNAASGIFHKENGIARLFCLETESDRTLSSELLGIVDEVVNHLFQTDRIRYYRFTLTFGQLHDQLYPPRHTQALRVIDLLHHKREVVSGKTEVH